MFFDILAKRKEALRDDLEVKSARSMIEHMLAEPERKAYPDLSWGLTYLDMIKPPELQTAADKLRWLLPHRAGAPPEQGCANSADGQQQQVGNFIITSVDNMMTAVLQRAPMTITLERAVNKHFWNTVEDCPDIETVVRKRVFEWVGKKPSSKKTLQFGTHHRSFPGGATDDCSSTSQGVHVDSQMSQIRPPHDLEVCPSRCI